MQKIIDHDTVSLVHTGSIDGVRTKRILAVLVDWCIVLALCIPVGIVIFLLGVATLGLGFILYGAMFPAIALVYSGKTMGSKSQATIGMRMMDIHIERLDGREIDFNTAAAHTFLFWAANVVATPLILLATFFTKDKRTVHDLLTETIVKRGTL